MNSQQKQTLIELSNVTNRFGDFVLHDEINFKINEGDIIGLIGGSGTGKSVLLNTILDLRDKSEGTITFKGKDIDKMNFSQKQNFRKQLGVLFQSGALFTNLSVLENVMFPIVEYTDLDKKSVQRMAYAKIKLVGLPDNSLHKKPSELSGGMIKRAALARALAVDSKILFLDEPTAGLDPIGAENFDSLILDLANILSLTVIMITHDLDSLYRICNQIAVLIDKKIIKAPLQEIIKLDHPWIQSYFYGIRGQKQKGD